MKNDSYLSPVNTCTPVYINHTKIGDIVSTASPTNRFRSNARFAYIDLRQENSAVTLALQPSEKVTDLLIMRHRKKIKEFTTEIHYEKSQSCSYPISINFKQSAYYITYIFDLLRIFLILVLCEFIIDTLSCLCIRK